VVKEMTELISRSAAGWRIYSSFVPPLFHQLLKFLHFDWIDNIGDNCKDYYHISNLPLATHSHATYCLPSSSTVIFLRKSPPVAMLMCLNSRSTIAPANPESANNKIKNLKIDVVYG
jgi:hypothetical protein